VAGIVNQIATASQEQARGLSEINTSGGHVDSMTQRNAAMVDEISAVARDMGDRESFVVEDSTAPAAAKAVAGAAAGNVYTLPAPRYRHVA
jgi:hypothetical protein